MPIDFMGMEVGSEYSRHDLARRWGYFSYHPLARGVVTPREDNKIILFITKDKPDFAEQYVNVLKDNTLEWQGPTDHFAESRMLAADRSADELHAFYRERHRSDFTYIGRLHLRSSTINSDRPSSFVFQVGEVSPKRD